MWTPGTPVPHIDAFFTSWIGLLAVTNDPDTGRGKSTVVTYQTQGICVSPFASITTVARRGVHHCLAYRYAAI